jgi:hypothetical protein
MSPTIRSLFDDPEAIARDGDEIELTESTAIISDAERKRLEAAGSALLLKSGDDANGNPLGTKSEDLMNCKRVSERPNAQRKRPDFVSEDSMTDAHARTHAATALGPGKPPPGRPITGRCRPFPLENARKTITEIAETTAAKGFLRRWPNEALFRKSPMNAAWTIAPCAAR